MQVLVLSLGLTERLLVGFAAAFLLYLLWLSTFGHRKHLADLRRRYSPGTLMAPFLASDKVTAWSARVTAIGACLMLILLVIVLVFFPLPS